MRLAAPAPGTVPRRPAPRGRGSGPAARSSGAASRAARALALPTVRLRPICPTCRITWLSSSISWARQSRSPRWCRSAWRCGGHAPAARKKLAIRQATRIPCRAGTTRRHAGPTRTSAGPRWCARNVLPRMPPRLKEHRDEAGHDTPPPPRPTTPTTPTGPLMLRCSCGADHAPTEQDHAAVDTDTLGRQFMEASLVKAMFPQEPVRRAFLKAVGRAARWGPSPACCRWAH
jgi:hypothetical protein